MTVSDWTGIAVGAVLIIQGWQQNRIFERQNKIFSAQAGAPLPENLPRKLKLYWPTAINVALALCIFGAVAYDHTAQPKPIGTIAVVVPWALSAIMAIGMVYVLHRSNTPNVSGKPATPPARRGVYDAVADCSMNEDRLGPWKYGCSAGVGNDFIPFRGRHSDFKDGVDRWFCPERPNDLGILHNRTNHNVEGEPRTYTIPANMMHMHPGIGGYCAVIRWQCPEDGTYTIEGAYEGLDRQDGADSEVHILRGSRALWNKPLTGVPSVRPFTRKEYLESGDTLDFVVSEGERFGADSVGLKVEIKKI